jgi:beta-phosphoglucomutase-like phosphatase (HAD superfamily)
MIDAIFWDNDGVLVDTEHLYFEATRDALDTIEIPLTEDDYRELFLLQGRGAWHLAEARGIPPAEVEALRQRRNARYAHCRHAGWLPLCPPYPQTFRDRAQSLW